MLINDENNFISFDEFKDIQDRKKRKQFIDPKTSAVRYA